MDNVSEKTLNDYLDLFNECLSKSDKEEIAVYADMSPSSIYSYLKGNIANKNNAKAILEKGLSIIELKYPHIHSQLISENKNTTYKNGE